MSKAWQVVLILIWGGLLLGCASFKPITERPPKKQWDLLGQAHPDDTERIYRAVFKEGLMAIPYLMEDLDSSVPVDGYCSHSYLSLDPVVLESADGVEFEEGELPGAPPGMLPDGRIEKKYFAFYLIRSILEEKYEMKGRCVTPVGEGRMKVDTAFREIKVLLEEAETLDASLLVEFERILQENNISIW